MDLGLQGKVAVVTVPAMAALDMPRRLRWHEKGHVLCYLADASLCLLRRAIGSRHRERR
jgi:hypothetical protein